MSHGTQSQMSGFTTRPIVMGTRGVVTAGHYLAAAAGFQIMEQGGNAIDAASAMCICLNLLEPQSCGIGGEVPTLIYSAKDKKTYAISGVGWAPSEFSIDWCRDNKIDLIHTSALKRHLKTTGSRTTLCEKDNTASFSIQATYKVKIRDPCINPAGPYQT